MKVLLDECIPAGLRHAFPSHEVHSVAWAGFKSKKNGQLLAAAEGAGYEVLVTVDRWRWSYTGALAEKST